VLGSACRKHVQFQPAVSYWPRIYAAVSQHDWSAHGGGIANAGSGIFRCLGPHRRPACGRLLRVEPAGQAPRPQRADADCHLPAACHVCMWRWWWFRTRWRRWNQNGSRHSSRFLQRDGIGNERDDYSHYDLHAGGSVRRMRLRKPARALMLARSLLVIARGSTYIRAVKRTLRCPGGCARCDRRYRVPTRFLRHGLGCEEGVEDSGLNLRRNT
jgi:hypothetical protein